MFGLNLMTQVFNSYTLHQQACESYRRNRTFIDFAIFAFTGLL